MKKKNTLLYLDEELVKKAKELKLNLSKIAENAIRLQMFPMMSTGEKAAIDFNNYLRNLEKENRCFFLPFELKKIQIKNIGCLSDLKLAFDRLNIIQGANGTGKTTFIRSIVYLFGYELSNFNNFVSSRKKIVTSRAKTHEIKIQIKPETKISLTYIEKNNNEIKEKRTTRCILIDEPMDRLSSNLKNDFLDYLRGLNTQIILTNTPHEKIEYSRQYKIFRLR